MAGLSEGGHAASIWLLSAILSLPFGARGEGEIAVIASRQWTDAQEISLSTLRRIYLGTVTRVSGRRVERFDLRAGSATREAFSAIVLGMTGIALENYWVEQALRGGPLPPREVSDLSELIRLVSAARGRLGYAPYAELLEADRSGIRIIAIRSSGGSWLPDAPRYPIRGPTRGDSQ